MFYQGKLNSLLKGSGVRLILFLSNVLIGIWMMPYLIHSLGLGEYGVWVYASSLISFYSLIDLGLFSAMHRYLMQSIYRGHREEISISLSTNLFLGFVFFSIAILITLLIAGYSSDFSIQGGGADEFALIIYLLGFKSAIEFALFPFYGVMMANYKYHVIGYLNLIGLFVRTLFVYVLVENGFGVMGVAYPIVIVQLLVTCFVVILSLKMLPSGVCRLGAIDFMTVKKYIGFSKYSFAISMSKRIEESTDNILVGNLFGADDVTRYSVASGLIQYFNSLISSLFGVVSSVYNDLFAKGKMEEFRSVYLVVTEGTVLISTYIAAGMFFFGNEFIAIWLGDGFDSSYYVLVALIIPAVFGLSNYTSLEALYVLGKHKSQAYISILEVIINILLSYLLAMHLGFIGVALGTALTISLNALFLRPIYTCSKLGVPIGAYYVLLIKTAGVAAVSGVGVNNLLPDISGNVYAFVLDCFVFTISYFLVYFYFVMSRPIKEALIRVFFKKKTFIDVFK